MSTTKFERERRNYKALKKYVYFDSATTGLIPQYSCDAMCRFIQERTEEGMDIDFYHEVWDFADQVREELSQLISAESGNTIAFGENSSSLFNILSNGITFHKGDNVVIYDTVYPAMLCLWLQKAKETGIEVRIVKSHNGEVSTSSLFEQVDENTKALTVCHVDSGTGYCHDLATIGSFCRERGIFFGVDATQSCGALPIDVQQMKIDFMTVSCSKWLQSLHGLGFAYISPLLLPLLKQTSMGWANLANRIDGNAYELQLSCHASRFEDGTLPMVALYGLHEVLRTMAELGKEDIAHHIFGLVESLYQKISTVPELSISYPYEKKYRSQLVYLTLPENCHLSEAILKEHTIRTKMQGSQKMRIALHYFNNEQDIDTLLQCMTQLIK